MTDNETQDWSLLKVTQKSLCEHMTLAHELRELLRDEHKLRMSLRPPWSCNEPDCFSFGNSMSRFCDCFRNRMIKHDKAVFEAIKEGGV